MVRYKHVISVLMRYGFEEIAGLFARRFNIGLGSGKFSSSKMKGLAGISLPQRIRMAAEELGPTFVKLGQILSTRPDLIPNEYIVEFQKLQDDVPAEDFNSIRELIKQELGDYPENIFATFDTEPIAAASIGQVYRAKTKDGREVILKIRRPGIEKIIQTDMEILRNIAVIIKHRLKKDDTIDPVRMVNEFSQAIMKEVDFTNERRNQQRFINNFKNDPTIHIPAVIEEYSTIAVLTMEFIDGIKPSNIEQLKEAGMTPKVIAAASSEFVLKQVFEHGFFHADPHPGNFLVIENNVLAPLDFGQVGRLTKQDQILLRYIVLSIVGSDAGKLVQGLERAQMLNDETDVGELIRDLEEILFDYQDLPAKDIPIGEALKRGFDVIRNHRIEPPRDFTLMIKSIMTIEAFSTDLDGDFQIIDHLRPYAKKFTLEQVSPGKILKQIQKATFDAGELAANLPDDIASILSKARRGNFKIHVHHDHLEQLEETLNNSSNRISFAVIIAALLIASSMLVPQDGWVVGIVHLQTLGIIGYVVAAIMGIWMLLSIMRNRRM